VSKSSKQVMSAEVPAWHGDATHALARSRGSTLNCLLGEIVAEYVNAHAAELTPDVSARLDVRHSPHSPPRGEEGGAR
jgi:hypothetical protein